MKYWNLVDLTNGWWPINLMNQNIQYQNGGIHSKHVLPHRVAYYTVHKSRILASMCHTAYTFYLNGFLCNHDLTRVNVVRPDECKTYVWHACIQNVSLFFLTTVNLLSFKIQILPWMHFCDLFFTKGL